MCLKLSKTCLCKTWTVPNNCHLTVRQVQQRPLPKVFYESIVTHQGSVTFSAIFKSIPSLDPSDNSAKFSGFWSFPAEWLSSWCTPYKWKQSGTQSQQMVIDQVWYFCPYKLNTNVDVLIDMVKKNVLTQTWSQETFALALQCVFSVWMSMVWTQRTVFSKLLKAIKFSHFFGTQSALTL